MLTHNAYVYSVNAKRLSTYQGSKKPVLIKGAVINNYNYDGTVTNKGKKYYYIGDHGYIRATNAKQVADEPQAGTLKLNYNTYVYDKNGKRLRSYRGSKKNTNLYKWHSIKYTGTLQPITNDSKQYYCLNDDNYSQFWLPYQTIKGVQYYNIGAGGYIKAANVDQIDGKPVYTADANITVKTHWANNPTKVVETTTGEKIKVGKKITVDRVTSMYDGNSRSRLYRIKGTTNDFISDVYVKVLPRQQLKIYTENSCVIFANNADAYNIQGEKQANKTQNIGTAFIKGDAIPVNELLYIWVPSENKAELFYRIEDSSNGTDQYGNDLFLETKDSQPSLYYVKASDVKYLSGPRLTKPENTPEEAKSDAKIASSTDKQALQKLIDQEGAVKASGDTYTGTNKEIYLSNLSTYNDILRTAKSINSSNKSTVAEIKEASWILTKAQQDVMNLEKQDNTMAPDSNYLF